MPEHQQPTVSLERWMDTGRNDPCTCGSGRKYKRCCLLVERAEGALRDELVELALADEERFKRVEGAFVSALPRDAMTEADLPVLFSIAIADHRDEDGTTLIQRFMERQSSKLAKAKRRALDRLAEGRWSLYQVLAVDPGVGLVLEDQLTGEVLEMRDVSASQALGPFVLFYGKLVRGRGAWMGEGGITVLEPTKGEEALAVLADLGATPGCGDPHAVLSEHALQAYGAMARLAASPLYEKAVTHEGDPVAEAYGLYHVEEASALVAGLEGHEEIYPAGIDEEGAQVFNWALEAEALTRDAPDPPGRAIRFGTHLQVPAGVEGPKGTEGPVVLATVKVRGSTVEVTCLSQRRLERTRHLLASMVTLDVEEEEAEEVDMAGRLRDAPPVPRPGESVPETTVDPATGPPAEEREALRERLRRQFMDEFPNGRVPALNGRTPREAAADPSMRSALAHHLRVLAFHAHQGQGLLDPGDVQALAEDLGVADLLAPGVPA